MNDYGLPVRFPVKRAGKICVIPEYVDISLDHKSVLYSGNVIPESNRNPKFGKSFRINMENLRFTCFGMKRKSRKHLFQSSSCHQHCYSNLEIQSAKIMCLCRFPVSFFNKSSKKSMENLTTNCSDHYCLHSILL